MISLSGCKCCKITGFNTIVGGSLLQAQPTLSPQDGDLCANTGWLLPHFALAHVEAYCLWKATTSRRPCVALLRDLWPSHRPHTRGEAGVGWVPFPVLFQKWAGPTKEQGENLTEMEDSYLSNWLSLPKNAIFTHRPSLLLYITSESPMWACCSMYCWG